MFVRAEVLLEKALRERLLTSKADVDGIHLNLCVDTRHNWGQP